MKLKRKPIAEKYADEIEAMYAQVRVGAGVVLALTRSPRARARPRRSPTSRTW